MLQREGIAINHKKTYRLYKAAGLALQKRSKKKKYEKRGMPERTAVEANARWSMDFVSDRTRYGSNIRVLTVIDEVTRECLALEVDSSLTGRRVCVVLNKIALFRGFPNGQIKRYLISYLTTPEYLKEFLKEAGCKNLTLQVTDLSALLVQRQSQTYTCPSTMPARFGILPLK